MNQGTYQRLKQVFHGAVELDPPSRSEFVARECADDDSLRVEVEQLLLQHDLAEGFLETPARLIVGSDAPAPNKTDPPAPGTRTPAPASGELRFANYTVLRTLGRGGMGVVYLAEQDGTRRTVALKVIRAGLATPGALKRFAFEAQVLGRLNHPGIAQIYDANAADAGDGPQPYFAMELVDGVPITQHARARALTTADRLALLTQVCDAVEYAHVKGIIHRDLKPGNILVDPAGQVKVLDFGVARATTPAADSGASTLPPQNTEPGQLVGTLPYMSPEQIAGDPDDLDTRSDVYALGVIAYELLADKPAYPVDRLPPLEAARLVKDTDPAPLSSFSKLYRGDIETVVAKAMDKDRTRRYQSAAALASDIRRYLSDQPVEARPASAWYQVRKFTKRNWPMVMGGGLAVVALSCGAAVAARFAVLEHRARNQADESSKREQSQRIVAEQSLIAADDARRKLEDEAVNARATGDFFRLLLLNVSPDRSQGQDPTLRDVLDTVINQENSGLRQHPRAWAAIEATVGEAYARLGDPAAGLEKVESALPVQLQLLGDHDRDTLITMHSKAMMFHDLGRTDEAIQLMTQVRSIRMETFGELDPGTLSSTTCLAAMLERRARYAEAEQLYRSILAHAEEARDENVLSATINLGQMLRSIGRNEEAAPLIRQAAEKSRNLLGPDHPKTLTAEVNEAAMLKDFGRLDESEQLLLRNIEARRQVHGPDSREVFAAQAMLGTVLLVQSRNEEAERLFREVADGRGRLLGPNHTDTAMSLTNLSSALARLGRFAEAEDPLRRGLEAQRAALGPSHPTTLGHQSQLADLMRRQGKFEEAIALSRETIKTAEEHRIDARKLATFHGILGRCLRDTGKFEEAEVEILVCLKELRTLNPGDPRLSIAERDLEELYKRWNRPDPAQR